MTVQTEWRAYELHGRAIDLTQWTDVAWDYSIELAHGAGAWKGARHVGVLLGGLGPSEERLWDRWRLEAVELDCAFDVEVFRSGRLVWKASADCAAKPFAGSDQWRELRSVPGGLYHRETLEAGPLHLGPTERFMLRVFARAGHGPVPDTNANPKVTLCFAGLSREGAAR